MAAPLRVGIVGSGAMASYHVKRFGSMEGVRVAAVADRDPTRAVAFAATSGVAQVFPDVDSLCSSGEVDAVAIASRDLWHREPSLVALSHGLPVFCEKPLARGLEEAREMAGAAKTGNIPTIVNFSKRNGGILSLAYSLVASGRLGGVTGVELSYSQSWLLQDSWGDFRSTPRWQWRLDEGQSTCGVLGDLGSHLLDAVVMILGEVRARFCVAQRFRPDTNFPWLTGGPAWESFSAVLASPGCSISASASFRARGHHDSFRLLLRGERADIEVDFERSREGLFLIEGAAAARQEIKAPPIPSTYDRFVALAGGKVDPLPEHPLDFGHGLRVQGLIAEVAAQASREEAGL